MKYHDNVFEYYDNLQEAYKTLLDHQKCDTKKFKLASSIGWVLLLLAIRFRETEYFWFLITFAAGCVIQGLIFFVDLSNRNSMLHMIDYFEWREQKARRITRTREAA